MYPKSRLWRAFALSGSCVGICVVSLLLYGNYVFHENSVITDHYHRVELGCDAAAIVTEYGEIPKYVVYGRQGFSVYYYWPSRPFFKTIDDKPQVLGSLPFRILDSISEIPDIYNAAEFVIVDGKVAAKVINGESLKIESVCGQIAISDTRIGYNIDIEKLSSCLK